MGEELFCFVSSRFNNSHMEPDASASRLIESADGVAAVDYFVLFVSFVVHSFRLIAAGRWVVVGTAVRSGYT